MIYDCFTFFNELDLLEIRLNVLNSAVDKFVLVEMTKTHSGVDKPLFYDENKERFAQFANKIIHIVVDDIPESTNPWVLETHQRNAIARGLKSCQPEDIILISDLDEIPDPNVISKINCTNEIYLLEMKMYYYFLNYLDFGKPIWRLGTKALSYKNFLNGLDNIEVPYTTFLPESINHGTTPSKIRMWNGAKTIPSAGWHFSYLGGYDLIIKKIKSFSHQEYNKSEFIDKNDVAKKIKSGKDLFNRKDHFYIAVPLGRKFPRYIVENKKRFNHLICPVSITKAFLRLIYHKKSLARFIKYW